MLYQDLPRPAKRHLRRARQPMKQYGRAAAGGTTSRSSVSPAELRPRGLRVSSRWPGFTKDDEKSTPSRSSAGKQPFESLLKAVERPNRKPARRRGTTSTATAATPEEMYERADFSPKEPRPAIIMARLHHRRLHCQHRSVEVIAARTACCCTFNRAMHAVIDRHPQSRHPLPGARPSACASRW